MVKLNAHIVAAAFLVLALTGTVTAQQQKVGYVDTDVILSQMPEYQNIQQELRSVSSDWDSELKRMDEEIEQLKEDFQSKKVLYTDEQRAQQQQQIQALIEQREQYLEQKFGAKGEYFQKQKELLEPIQRSVFEAINTIAEQEGFDFIFDRAQNAGLLFGKKEFNLNEKILQQLGITLNQSSN
ncbi:OmpH family outer membrane protein [Fodinibius salsisoli]|uniref:OmpH family outer membrane protein n=1 Tax=Fodinibius salsisoli TaxID=2820877 RepID=A0ABT3PPK1_9BACT|nr:OmpH family outer membrane protein [Fodinibius salsisoli]MCW9707766.1 OmpH family outer membrane protein [Fodinibius salsisoli]